MFLRQRLIVALDAGSVSGALVSSGLVGPRLRAFARVDLAPGALVPSPLEANLVRPEEVREALERLAAALGTGRATVVLPDGLARVLLLETPGEPVGLEYASFRLAQGLPYPVAEAVVDVLPLGRARSLAAAVRRRIVEEYEAAAAGAGFAPERVHLAPLAAVAGLARHPPGRGPAVDVILGDAAMSFAAFEGGVLRLFRSRRRDPGPDELARLAREVERTCALAGNGAAARVRVVGPGAAALIREIAASGRTVEPGWAIPHDGLSVEPAELAWLGAARG